MYLEKLEIQGFKSFAHKTTLEFQRGIAVIVGPNGSGKSNVADAVRWVLGEQSLKMIRGKKSEDVIFAGSDKKTRLGMAEVTLTLDNADRKAPIDYDKVVIARRIYKDGTSEYIMNGSATRLSDIQLLLARSNIGQRTYSVIGQGAVDAVLLASPTERKEFFDEAAGVRPFQMKREQAEHKLAATRENLGQAQLLIDEIAPRLRSLTRQVKRLSEREEIQKGLRDLQVQAYATKLVGLRQELHLVREKAGEAETEQESALEFVSTIQAKLDQEERGSTRHESFNQLQNDYQQLVEKRNRLLTERAALAGKVAASLAKAGQSNLVWLNAQKSEYESKLQAAEDAYRHLKEKFAKLNEQAKSAKTEAEAFDKEIKNIENQLLKAEESLKTKTTLTLPDLAKDVVEVVTRHQKFLQAIKAAVTPEEFSALKKEAHRLEIEADKFVQKINAQAPSIDPTELIALQRSLHESMKAKEIKTRAENILSAEVKILNEKLFNEEKEISRLKEELGRISKDLKLSDLKPKNPAEAEALVNQAQDEMDKQLAELEAKIQEAKTGVEEFNKSEQGKRDKLFALQREAREAQDQVREAESRLGDLRVDLARLETREEDILRELRAELPAEYVEKVESAKKIPEHTNLSKLEEEVAKTKHALELIGGIDENAVKEYEETKTRYDFLTTQVADLNKAAEDLEVGIQKLEKIIKEKFETSFSKVSLEFSKYFKILFNGGHASLELVKEIILPPEAQADLDEDEEDGDEAEEMELEPKKIKGEKVVTGVDIFATPPGKKLRGIGMLSGGERALTSIALICAILASNPSPFVVLDEVDAALDESNSIRFAQILEKLAHRTQFITISHNRATMQRAILLYGVTMGDDGVSKLLSVKMEDVDKVVNSKH
ncbi:MAG: AAA family ATPase [Patescibacteria group bacterium]|jgi:chromosome segregation protein